MNKGDLSDAMTALADDIQRLASSRPLDAAAFATAMNRSDELFRQCETRRTQLRAVVVPLAQVTIEISRLSRAESKLLRVIAKATTQLG